MVAIYANSFSNLVAMLNRYLVILLLSIGYCFQSKATHIVGGEMSYKYLGDNKYEVTLVMYRDCGPDNTRGTGFDSYAAIGIYKGGLLFDSFTTNFLGSELVPIESLSPCLAIPDGICIEAGSYKFSVTLPGAEDDYIIAYQRCCRNQSLINVQDANNTGLTLLVNIPTRDALLENNSPKFVDFPAVVMCINDTIRIQHNAIDIDGDSLVYSFYTPFHGATADDPVANPPTAPPYEELIWKTEYSEAYLMDGNPGLTIDAQTGELHVNPTKKGKFNIGVAVDEYRNELFISRVIRDFYLTVTDCIPVEAIINDNDPCLGLTTQLTNSSFGGYEYIWSFPEEDPSARRFGPTVNYTFTEKGEQLVKLLVKSKTGCQDSTTKIIEVYPRFVPELVFPDTICIDMVLDDISLEGDYEDYIDVFWDFGEGGLPRYVSTPVAIGVSFITRGTQQIFVLADQDICHYFDSTTVEVIQTPIPLFEIDADTGCVPFEVNVTNLSDVNGTANYRWNMGNGVTLSNLDTNYVYSYYNPGEYNPSLTIDFSSGCIASFEYNLPTIIKVYEPLVVSFEVPPIACLEDNGTRLFSQGNQTATAEFNWFTPNAIGDSLHHADTINNLSYLAAGLHKVTLDVVDHYCESTYTNWVEVQNNPNALFTITDDILCVENEIHFLNQSTADTELSYAWYFGEKDAYSVEENPTYVYRNVKDYHVELMVYTSEGCIDTAVFVLDSNITVYPLPDPNFEIADRALDITNPVSSITNWSDSAIFGYYRVHPTNDIIDGLEEHTYEFEPGKHEVWQVVTNRYGCVDSTKRVIEVLGHTIYAPNAFSPNNDGVNDGFRAYVRGAVAYTIMVLDRWGNVVFSTTNQEEVWRGILSNGNQAKSDVYSYRIELQEIKGVWHKYIGRVTLVR
jgi:gliding motility-associated-like protein